MCASAAADKIFRAQLLRIENLSFYNADGNNERTCGYNLTMEEKNYAHENEILQCQFESWYFVFAKNTIKSTIIKMQQEFVDYLKEDGVYIPVKSIYSRDDLSDDEGLVTLDDCDEDNTHRFALSPAMEKEISKALSIGDRGVFVKTNWSAPTDAAWLFAGSLRCRTIEDILLLLKSSERISFDIEHMFDRCPDSKRTKPDDLTLIIRKWADLAPSMEFRVFVCGGRVVGISQRNCCTYFPFLNDEKKRISEMILRFHESVVRGRFSLNSYALDVYIDKKNRIWIIDFNVFGEPTNPLLFEWSELFSYKTRIESHAADIETVFDIINEKTSPVSAEENANCHDGDCDDDFFRIVESESEVLPSVAATSRGPIDVHMASDFSNFMNICKKQQASSDDENDD